MNHTTRRQLRALMSALFPALLLLLWAGQVWGAELPGGFSVSALPAFNQQDSDAAYFDLAVTPGLTQELLIEIRNHGQLPATIRVETVTATTSRTGLLHYSPGGISHPALPAAFSQMAFPVEERLQVPPNSSLQAAVSLIIPFEPWQGTLLGAVRIVLEPEAPASGDETGIVNQYSYVIPIRLTQGQTPDPAFSLTPPRAELVNHKSAVVVGVANPVPLIIQGARVKAAVYPSGSDTPVISLEQENVEIAPCSVFPITLTDQAGYGFAPGSYRVVAGVTWGGEHWQLSEDFILTPQEAQHLNDASVNQLQAEPPSRLSSRPWAGLLAAVTAGGLLAVRLLPLWPKKA